MQEERYDLVIPLEFLNAAAVQAVLDIIVSRPFQQELETLGGYIALVPARWWLNWPPKRL